MKNEIINEIDFYNNEELIKSELGRHFGNKNWLNIFFEDKHHGFLHASQVREGVVSLSKKLTSEEMKKILEEGVNISVEKPFESAIAVAEIAAVFHDCGRFNNEGELKREEQKNHYIYSYDRAEILAKELGFEINTINFLKDAIYCHDYQNKKITPHLDFPKTIIGKLVQSSDQLGWFHPGSVHRTMEYGKQFNRPFYDSNTSFEERINWKNEGVSGNDCLTVMLAQLYGPRDEKRFGIKAARDKIEKHRPLLKENILEIAREYNVEKDVKDLIAKYEAM